MNWLASVLCLNYLDSLSSVFQREEQRNAVATLRGEFPGCDHFGMNSDFSSSECLLDVLPLAVVFLLSCLSVCLSPFLSAIVLSFKWHFLWRKHLQWSFVGDGRARHRRFFHSPVQRNTFSLLNWEIIGSELTLQWGLKGSFHSRGLSDASPFRPGRLSLQGFHSPGAPDWHKISKILKQCQTWTQSDNIAFLCWSLLLRWDLVLYPRHESL